AARSAERIAWLIRGVAIVFAFVAATRGFRAFTLDPTLGIRRVSRRLVLSHVLVVSVPLAIVLALWISSTYLGVNADRALITTRAIEREALRLHETLATGLGAGAGAEAGARAVHAALHRRWPGTRLFVVAGDSVGRAAGDT